ncbi:MAG: DNA alkylation repair protein [Candidatus Buchananbacteria bacterium]
MTTPQIVKYIKQQAKQQANPKKAGELRRFFTEPIKTYGLTVPQGRQLGEAVFKLAKEQGQAINLKQAIAVTEKLFAGQIMEEVYAGFQILDKFKPEIYHAKMFGVYTGWMRHVSNWAHNDLLTAHFIGGVIGNNPALVKKILPWVKSKNRWLRRAAATSLINPAKRGSFLAEVLFIAKALRFDRDDLVCKGVGWLLREAAKQHQRQVVNFLLEYKQDFARITLNYAWEKLPENLKNKLKA